MIFISKNGDLINTEPENTYFKRVFDLISYWNSNSETLELQTSGSTGNPKIIVGSRARIVASIEMTRKAFNLHDNDLFFCCLNVNYIAGIMMVFRALHIGANLLVVEPTSNPLLNLGNQEYLLSKVKVFHSFVPLQIETILKNPKSAILLNSAKAIIIGGASINSMLSKMCSELFVPIYATFGMTETLSHIAIRDLRKEGESFKILEGVTIEVNTKNCLRINAASTSNEWIQTNDVVELIDNSSFIVRGRIDNIINSGGVKIQLEEIERKIEEKLNLDSRFFCFGIRDELLGQKLILIIEGNRNTVTKEQLQGFLTKFEVPKEIFHIENFVETLSGKISKIKTVNEILNH